MPEKIDWSLGDKFRSPEDVAKTKAAEQYIEDQQKKIDEAKKPVVEDPTEVAQEVEKQKTELDALYQDGLATITERLTKSKEIGDKEREELKLIKEKLDSGESLTPEELAKIKRI